MTKRLKLGDRVKLTSPFSFITLDSLGTVVNLDSNYSDSVGVQWDVRQSGFHNCEDSCPEGTGWFVQRNDILLVSSYPPLTTQEKVLAKMKELDERFISRTLPKCTSTPLPLGA